MKNNGGITLRQILERAFARRNENGVFYAHQSGYGDYNSHIEISFPKHKPIRIAYRHWSLALPHVKDSYGKLPASLRDLAHAVVSDPENPATQYSAIVNITGDLNLASALTHLWEDWVLEVLGFDVAAAAA